MQSKKSRDGKTARISPRRFGFLRVYLEEENGLLRVYLEEENGLPSPLRLRFALCGNLVFHYRIGDRFC